MILVDTSVWIDVLSKRGTPAVEQFERAIYYGPPVCGDLIKVEILQGFREPQKLKLAETTLSLFDCVSLCSPDLAPKAAANFRLLRRRGITVRGTIDIVIATWCIENGVALLHNDRDFAQMEQALGIKRPQ